MSEVSARLTGFQVFVVCCQCGSAECEIWAEAGIVSVVCSVCENYGEADGIEPGQHEVREYKASEG